MNVRRVVTGTDAEGKSVFVSDEMVEPITIDLLPGGAFHRLWGADDTVQLPVDGKAAVPPMYFPPANGFRFGFFTMGPESVMIPPDLDIGAAFAEMQERLPGLADVMEPDNPGMHTTDSVDYDIVISGEVYMELDDGAEVHLKAGDCVIQNGTRHAWHNRSDQPCVIAVTLVAARPPAGS